MSLTRRAPVVPAHLARSVDGVPPRGRPRARNEILRSGQLAGLDAVDLERLATWVGTPFYLYDVEVIDRQVGTLRAILPPGVELAFAMKANPALAVVAHLAGEDAPGGHRLGLDVASEGELAVARAAGVPADRIVFTGPGKRDGELTLAVEHGLRAVTIESVGELERLERQAEASGCGPVPVLLRAAVSEGARLERVRLVGDDGAGKFGMDRSDLHRAADLAARSPRLDPLGVHAFGASNVLDAAALANHIDATVELAREVATRAGSPLRLVDVGGGLGIPYGPTEESLDLATLERRLRRAAARWADDPTLRELRVLLEPGRFLVGPAGAYVSRVLDRKTVGERTIVVLDGGVHHLLRPVLTGVEHRVRVLTGPATGPTASRRFPVTIAGPLCSGLDVFVDAAVVAPPEPGDLVAVLDAGAYGYTEAMPMFLSHPAPAEVAIRRGRTEVIRERIEPAVWLAGQRVPAWG
jgi:diaminopimelate decarboxylase